MLYICTYFATQKLPAEQFYEHKYVEKVMSGQVAQFSAPAAIIRALSNLAFLSGNLCAGKVEGVAGIKTVCFSDVTIQFNSLVDELLLLIWANPTV